MFLDTYKNKKVLITGHTGFKGSWLTLWLQKLGASVTGYALPPSYPSSHFELLSLESDIQHHEADMRDYKSLEKVIKETKPHFIFHLAAQALVRTSYQEPKETFDINVGGAVNLLEALRKTRYEGVLVYITSDKCYRNQEWDWGYRETDALGGKDPYSGSKGAAELVLYSYYHSFFKENPAIRVASARAGNVIGGGDWADNRIIPDCMRALMHERPITIRHPHATRPWQHVLEPLGAYLTLGAALENDETGQVQSSWNFGPDKYANKNVSTLVSHVIKHWGKGEFSVQQDPTAPHEDTFLQLNCDKAHQKLGWSPIWGFADGVQKTVEWYRRFHAKEDVKEISSQQIDAYTQKAYECITM